jgi:hypothetical protein
LRNSISIVIPSPSGFVKNKTGFSSGSAGGNMKHDGKEKIKAVIRKGKIIVFRSGNFPGADVTVLIFRISTDYLKF